MKEAYNNPRYGRVYIFKYYLILDSHNNWMITYFLYDGTEIVEYDYTNRTILDGNVMIMSFIITKGNYEAIDADDTSYHG